MGKKLYAIVDNYFEDCVFASYDKYLIDLFMQYPARKSRYDILVIKDKKIRKEFERLYTDGDSYIVVGNNVMVSIEYEVYINTIPTTLLSIQSAMQKILQCIDLIKLTNNERELLEASLEILYHITDRYFTNKDDVINHDINISKFISEEYV